MNRSDFREWIGIAKRQYQEQAGPSLATRSFAVRVRPHDPELAGLYEKLADASDAIRAHILRDR